MKNRAFLFGKKFIFQATQQPVRLICLEAKNINKNFRFEAIHFERYGQLLVKAFLKADVRRKIMLLFYKTYKFAGYALSEARFSELKYYFHTNRHSVEQYFKVDYLKETLNELKFTIAVVFVVFFATICLGATLAFFPQLKEWLGIVFFIFLLSNFCTFGSLLVSLINFLSYLSKKNGYGKFQLYLLEVCPDFRSYMHKISTMRF